MVEFSYKENYWRVFGKFTTFAIWIFEASLALTLFTFAYRLHYGIWAYLCYGLGTGCLHVLLSSFRKIITHQDFIIDTYNKTVSDVIEKAKEITLEEIMSE